MNFATQGKKKAVTFSYDDGVTQDFRLVEVDLQFDDGALSAIADKAIKKDTGARALRAIIEEFMLDIMYEIPKDENIGRVTITKEYLEGCGGPRIEIRGSEMRIPAKEAEQGGTDDLEAEEEGSEE